MSLITSSINDKMYEHVEETFDIAGRLTNIEPILKNINISKTEHLEYTSNTYSDFIKSLKISFLDKGYEWYNNIKIEGENNTKFKIKSIDMTNVDAFKLNGIISTYIEYVAYYNKLTDVVSDMPNIDQIRTIHNELVLSSMEKLRDDLLVLKDNIVSLSNYIVEVIKDAIDKKMIIIEEITFEYYLDLIFDHLRIRRKLPINIKHTIERI